MWRSAAPVALVMVLAAGSVRGEAGEAPPAGLPPGVKVQQGIVYGRVNGAALKMDLYLPAAASGPMPVIVRFSPEREQPERPANELLAKGYALAYAGYLPEGAPRLQAFDRFPLDIQSAKAAIRWIRGNAAAQGFDPERIGVWGAEHGATVAALLGVTADQAALNGSIGEYPQQSSAVRAVCLFGGTTDWRNAELYGDETVNIPGSAAYQLFGGNPKEHPDEARVASAVNYVRPTSPAVLMVTLASDSNRAMHLIFAETLKRAGVPSALYEEKPGAGAGPGGRAVDEAKLDRTILEFFADTLAPNHTPPKMTLEQEIQQLAKAGLYKQARRLIEEQVGRTSGAERSRWLTMMRRIDDQQREPALRKLVADQKKEKAAQWTIREVLTDPDHIGEYQVEATYSSREFDRLAATLRQVEALNGAVQRLDWAAADREAGALRNDLQSGDAAQGGIAGEFLSRYNAVRAHPGQSWPPGVQPVGYAAAFGQDLYGYWFDMRAGGVMQRFRYVPPGTFARGSSPNEWGRLPGEPPLVKTEIKKGFWLADSPVTQSMWEGVEGKGENHSHFKGAELPVDSMSYAHAVNFMAKLGLDARLPTRDEWEYACRAGATGPYAGTGRLSDIAWFWDEAHPENGALTVRILNELETDRTVMKRSTHEVKQKLPNRWGLYDMQGNVWEWCSGTSADKPYEYHVVRGGSWISIPQSCRAGREAWLPIETEAWNVGVRILIPAQSE